MSKLEKNIQEATEGLPEDYKIQVNIYRNEVTVFLETPDAGRLDGKGKGPLADKISEILEMAQNDAEEEEN